MFTTVLLLKNYGRIIEYKKKAFQDGLEYFVHILKNKPTINIPIVNYSVDDDTAATVSFNHLPSFSLGKLVCKDIVYDYTRS